MSYDILLGPDAHSYLQNLDSKSERIVKKNLKKLENGPYPRPDSGPGDAEKVTVDGEKIFRLHIGRSHTAFYHINEGDNAVQIVDIMDINTAHKMYD
ncbi:MAG: type II toxin-antitoxin system RelE/ParE family toxin [Candidatus Nanohaloarchaea archaeon]|nr:type II toxin-antitoxin system RelE/ParE family toxin [Candidatus Nanohaloarchaea archaeon]